MVSRISRSPIYQLKVSLMDIKPPIWRRIEVPGSATLHNLHWIIQLSMGWTNSHLHSFTIDEREFAQLEHFDDPVYADEFEYEDEHKYTLNKLRLAVKDRFLYLYDFGDNWRHNILVEYILPPSPDIAYPRVTGGKRRCPPEDVGGTGGYEDFLEAIKDPEHEEHESYLEWAGGSFDPEYFSLREVNEALHYQSLNDMGDKAAGRWA